MKQKELANWLKGIVIICGLFGLIFSFVIVPWMAKDTVKANPEYQWLFIPGLAFFWVTVLIFYAALVLLWKICTEISKDHSFCVENAKRLKIISGLAIAECMLYIVAEVIMSILSIHALLIIAGILCVGIFVAVAAAILSHLVEKASKLQQESDLTI